MVLEGTLFESYPKKHTRNTSLCEYFLVLFLYVLIAIGIASMSVTCRRGAGELELWDIG